MKNTLRKTLKTEEGKVFILVLVLLVVGGLVLAPLLGLMSTGLVAGQVYERKAAELYAADAGVEDAMWKIYNPADAGFPVGCRDTEWSEPYEYEITGVNGRSVAVTIDYLGNNVYRITSTAADEDEGDTRIVAYTSVLYMDFSDILNYAISSDGSVTIKSGCTVDGDVYLYDKDDLDNKGSINGTVVDADEVELTWPTYEQLDGYYWPNVDHLDPLPNTLISIPSWTTQENPLLLGPLLVNGNLEIKGSGWIRLEGTIYVKGNLTFNPTPTIHLDLNTNTLFVGGTIVLNPGVILYGSGCVIARGDIDFQPGLTGEADQYVLVLSLEGTTILNPNGDFHGTVAGDVHVQMQPGNALVWVSPYGRGLNYPIDEGEDYPPVVDLTVASWEIK